MSEESLDFWDTHILGIPFVVEQDVALDPCDIGLFGADGIVLDAYDITNLIKQSLATSFHSALRLGVASLALLVYTDIELVPHPIVHVLPHCGKSVMRTEFPPNAPRGDLISTNVCPGCRMGGLGGKTSA